MAATLGNRGAVALLIKLGANVHLKDTVYGQTPMHVAAWYGHTGCCMALMLSRDDDGAGVS